MKKYFAISILSLVFIFSAMIFASVSAQNEDSKPEAKIEIKDVKAEPADGGLKISATIFNPSQSIVSPEVAPLLILENIDPLIPSKDERNILSSLIISAMEGKEFFSLQPGEEKSFSYILPISARVPQKNYNLLIKLIRSSGQTEAYAIKIVKESGSVKRDGFLAFDQENCFVVGADGKNYGNNDGPIFSPADSPVVRCSIKNIGKEDITVSPKIILKEFYVYGKPLHGTAVVEKQKEKIFFKAGETKTVSLSMPKAEKPQTYQALLSFEDESEIQASFNMPFRWTIGGESARVKEVSQTSQLKKNYSKKDKISLSVDYFGSSDLFWVSAGQRVSNLSNLTMKTIVKDENGVVCGQKEEILPSITDGGEKNKITEVVLNKDCKGASYDVSLFSAGKNMAGQSGVLAKVVKENKFLAYKNTIWLFVFAVWVYVFLIIRKKSSVKKYIFFFFVLSLASATFGIASAVSLKIYPDEGGVTDKGTWWGSWFSSGGSATLKSTPANGGSNNLKVYSVEVNFSDYIDATDDQRIRVYINYKAADSSCVNTNMKVGFKMFLNGDNISKTAIGFAKYGSDSFSQEKRYSYDNENTNAVIEKSFNIDPDDIKNFYDTDGNFTIENPKLIIEMRQAGYQAHDNKYSKGYFTDSSNALITEDEAFDRGDILRVITPFRLPDPELTSLSANPTSLDFKTLSECTSGKSSVLSWSAQDMDSCTASASPANSQWTGNKSKTGGSQTITGITQDTDFTLTCSKKIGSNTYSYSKTATIDTTCKTLALGVSCTADKAGTVDVNQSVNWTATIDDINKGTPPYNYEWTNSASGSLSNTSNTTYSVTTSYPTTGTKQADIKVTDYASKTAESYCDVTVEKKPRLKISNTGCGKVTVVSASESAEPQVVENDANNGEGWVYSNGENLTLTAEPSSAGDSFNGWGGSCSGANSTCNLTMTTAGGDEDVTSSFECEPVVTNKYKLIINMTGDGSGSVWQESPAISSNIVCQKTGGVNNSCEKIYEENTQVQLRGGTSGGDNTFINGWLSGCDSTVKNTGNNAVYCNVKVTSAKSVTANFGYTTSSCSGDSCGCVSNCGGSPVCGNGIIESGEACDDGNTTNGDGCSSSCQTETGGSADQCGSSDGNCIGGTPVNLADSSTQYIWQCGSLSCTLPISGGSSGQCGTEKETCPSGGGTYSDTPSDTSDYYYWTCGSLQCSASKDGSTSDQCGDSVNQCDYGTWSDLTDSDTQYIWKCGELACSSPKSGSGGNITVSASVSSISATIVNNLPADSGIAKINLELDGTAKDQDKLSLTADLSSIGGASGALSEDCKKDDKKTMAFYSIDSGSNWSCYKGAVSLTPVSLGGAGTAELWIKIHYVDNTIFDKGLTMPITIPVNISDDNGYVISPSTVNLSLTAKKVTTQWQEI